MTEPGIPDAVTEGVIVADHGAFTPTPDPDDPRRFPPGTFIEYDGHRWRIAEQVGLMPLMDYAEIAEEGADSDAIAGLAAMRRLLQNIIDDRDWRRFHRWTVKERINGDTFAAIVGQAMEAIGNRPTESPSGSPGGASTTGPNSNATSGVATSQPDAWTERKRLLGIVPIEDDLSG